MKTKKAIAFPLSAFVCFLILLSGDHSRVQAFILKNLLKPQDIEYELKVWFDKKLTPEKIQEEIKQIEEKYKVKAVRKVQKHIFELKVQKKNEYEKLAKKIKKERKKVANVEINPLLTDLALQKVQVDKIKVRYKKFTKPYQIKFTEKYFKLKLAGKPLKSSDKSTEIIYGIKPWLLVREYNRLRKLKVIQEVGFVKETEVVQAPEEEKGIDLTAAENKEKTVKIAEKKLKGEKLTREEEAFFNSVLQPQKITADIKKKYPEIIKKAGTLDEYIPRGIGVTFKKILSDEELRAFEQKYNVKAEWKSTYKFSPNYGKAFGFIILSDDITSLDLEIILKEDPLVSEANAGFVAREPRVKK